MNVVVAEKPSVARDLAKVLGANQRKEGYLEGNGWRITWALGHLATLKTPDQYDAALKRWSLEHLPFVPERFELRPVEEKGDRKAQLDRVAELCRDADELVCATDAGREGELIFRYILEYAGCPGRPHKRLWLSSLTEQAIQQGFDKLKDGADYENLHAAARSRSEADWIVGLNATRAYTVRYGGGSVLWSLGRVQTPVLAMIAQKDDEIRCFDARPFWELRTRYRSARFKYTGDRFREQAPAQELLEKVTGEPLTIDKVEKRRESQPPPLLYDLTQLQRDMNLRHGMSAARTLAVAQELYEKKVLTYPRTDSRHLSRDMVDAVRTTLAKLRQWNPDALQLLADYVAAAPEGERGPRSAPKRVFDDAKVSDHHAIVPTGKLDPLGGEQKLVFDAVATRLVQVFLGNKEQDVTTAHALVADVPFRARGVVVTDPGWSALEPKAQEKPKARGKKKAKADDEDDKQELPPFEQGESGPHEPELHEGKTKPPRPFTENTLLAAMETCGKMIDDEQLREAMKGRGIGTPATRASIVETLLSRGYIRREKKALRVTDLGRYLIAVIADPVLKSPEMTGEWEQKLGEIERGKRDRSAFMDEIGAMIRSLIFEGLSPRIDARGLGQCPRCQAEVIEGREAYGCARWREDCQFRLPKVYRGLTLSREQVRELCSRGVVLRPVTIDGARRILCRTATGEPIDLEAPSRDAQPDEEFTIRAGWHYFATNEIAIDKRYQFDVIVSLGVGSHPAHLVSSLRAALAPEGALILVGDSSPEDIESLREISADGWDPSTTILDINYPSLILPDHSEAVIAHELASLFEDFGDRPVPRRRLSDVFPGEHTSRLLSDWEDSEKIEAVTVFETIKTGTRPEVLPYLRRRDATFAGSQYEVPWGCCSRNVYRVYDEAARRHAAAGPHVNEYIDSDRIFVDFYPFAVLRYPPNTVVVRSRKDRELTLDDREAAHRRFVNRGDIVVAQQGYDANVGIDRRRPRFEVELQAERPFKNESAWEINDGVLVELDADPLSPILRVEADPTVPRNDREASLQERRRRIVDGLYRPTMAHGTRTPRVRMVGGSWICRLGEAMRDVVQTDEHLVEEPFLVHRIPLQRSQRFERTMETVALSIFFELDSENLDGTKDEDLIDALGSRAAHNAVARAMRIYFERQYVNFGHGVPVRRRVQRAGGLRAAQGVRVARPPLSASCR